jgi:hypothetical protein
MAFFLPADIKAAAGNTTVQVNISEVAQITVSPASLNWSSVTPGANGSVQKITVKNTGSTTFSNGIYVSVDSFVNTTNNPTAGDDPAKYMAGSFMVIANTTDQPNDQYWFINQMSWNETNYPSPTSPTANAVSWGYYQNKSNSWLWEIVPPTGETSCRNGTGGGASFIIVNTAGSKDLSSVSTATFITNNSLTWGTFNFTTGPLKDYCVAVHTSCNYMMIYKYDMNSSLPNCWIRGYAAPGSFAPGIEKYFDVKPHVPNGVPAGTVTNSTITFTAS